MAMAAGMGTVGMAADMDTVAIAATMQAVEAPGQDRGRQHSLQPRRPLPR